MSEEKFKKGYLIAALFGAIGGGVLVYGITKWLPEQQEKIAARQAEIIEERITKKLENLERVLREYRGA